MRDASKAMLPAHYGGTQQASPRPRAIMRTETRALGPGREINGASFRNSSGDIILWACPSLKRPGEWIAHEIWAGEQQSGRNWAELEGKRWRVAATRGYGNRALSSSLATGTVRRETFAIIGRGGSTTRAALVGQYQEGEAARRAKGLLRPGEWDLGRDWERRPAVCEEMKWESCPFRVGWMSRAATMSPAPPGWLAKNRLDNRMAPGDWPAG